MGQIIGRTAKPDACNLRSLSSFGTPAAGQHILVSTDNSAMENGQGNFDAYVVGDGKTAATALPLKSIMPLGVFDLSAYTGSTYVDLAAALNAMNTLSAAYKKGGMSVKFVQSSDNMYVQYRLMADTWSTTVSDWQGVDEEPISGSKNLIESGGVKIDFDRNLLLCGGTIKISESNVNNIILTSSGSSGSVIAATSSYNGFVLKVSEGDVFAFSAVVGNVSPFDKYPQIGDTVTQWVNNVNTYTVPADVNYILLTFTTALIGNLQITIKNSNDELFKSVGSIPNYMSVYDVTNAVPLVSGYYTHDTAIAAVPSKYRHSGVIIKYYDGSAWNYDQYVGVNLNNWNNNGYWKINYKPYLHLWGTVFKSLGAIDFGKYPNAFPVVDVFTVQNTSNLDIILSSVTNNGNRFTIIFSNKLDNTTVAVYTTQQLNTLVGIKKLRCGEENSSGVIIDVVVDFDMLQTASYFFTLNAEIIQKQDILPILQDLSNKVNNVQSSIDDNTKAIGTKSEIYIRTDFNGMYWGQTKVYAANERYNGIVVPIYLGAHYRWENVYGYTDRITGVVFDHYPAVNDTGATDIENGFTATNGQKYLLLSFNVAKVTQGVKIVVEGIGMKKVDFTLLGKNIVCLGESTTEFVNSDGKGWPSYAADYTGGTFIVGAIGGSRLSQRQEPVANPTTDTESYAALDMCNLVTSWIADDWSNVDAAVTWLKNNASDDNTAIIQHLKDNPIANTDIIVILGGGNDMNSGTPLGEPTDKNKTTLFGAMNFILDAILTANPKVKIYWVSLMAQYRSKTWTHEYWSDNCVFSAYNKTIPQVLEIMEGIVKTYHIQWCDLYWTLFNEYNAKSYYTTYYGDGNARNDFNHPWGGFDVMGRKIGSFLLANQLQP